MRNLIRYNTKVGQTADATLAARRVANILTYMLRSRASAQRRWRRKAHERNRPSRLALPPFARSIGSLPNMSLQPTRKKRSRLNSIVGRLSLVIEV
jgi:hypothetical protein